MRPRRKACWLLVREQLHAFNGPSKGGGGRQPVLDEAGQRSSWDKPGLLQLVAVSCLRRPTGHVQAPVTPKQLLARNSSPRISASLGWSARSHRWTDGLACPSNPPQRDYVRSTDEPPAA